MHGYAYDPFGNLIVVSGPTSYRAVYDAFGRRTWYETPDGELTFIYDGDTLLGEADLDGYRAVYIWGLLGPIARVDLRSPAGTRYYVIDGLGHTRLLLDSSGGITDRYSYDAWGNPIEQTGTTFNPFRWNGAAGYEWTPATGLYHVGAREYDPRTARWLQPDPIDAASGDPNLYRYCGNDPINAVDPSGLDWLDTMANFWAGVGDSLTFGATDWLRERLGVNEVVDKCSTAYRVGEYTEVAAEVALTGGSKLLLRLATKKGAKVARGEGLKYYQHLKHTGKFVHHRNPLVGHPGGFQALFPLGGLSPHIHSSRWNLEVVDAATHLKRHHRMRRLETVLQWNTNRYTTSARSLNNLRRDCSNGFEDGG